MIDTMIEVVGEWAEQTFPRSTYNSILNHLRREIKELEDNPEDPEEWADCMILLMHYAYKAKFTQSDIALKLGQIKMRDYSGEPDEEGVVEHRRQEETQ